jgi:hypothetical protein
MGAGTAFQRMDAANCFAMASFCLILLYLGYCVHWSMWSMVYGPGSYRGVCPLLASPHDGWFCSLPLIQHVCAGHAKPDGLCHTFMLCAACCTTKSRCSHDQALCAIVLPDACDLPGGLPGAVPSVARLLLCPPLAVYAAPLCVPPQRRLQILCCAAFSAPHVGMG